MRLSVCLVYNDFALLTSVSIQELSKQSHYPKALDLVCVGVYSVLCMGPACSHNLTHTQYTFRLVPCWLSINNALFLVFPRASDSSAHYSRALSTVVVVVVVQLVGVQRAFPMYYAPFDTRTPPDGQQGPSAHGGNNSRPSNTTRRKKKKIIIIASIRQTDT